MSIELAIIFPALLLLAVPVADLGLGIFRKMQVQTAAQAGAEYAAVHGYDESRIENAIVKATGYSQISASPDPALFCGCPSQSGITTASCGSVCSSGSVAAQFVQSSAAATYQTLITYPMVPRSFSFTARSTVRIR